MGMWTIYDKNGNPKHMYAAEVDDSGNIVRQDTLELHEEWMGECYLTVSIKNAEPIDFAVGDYIDYRGERYTIEYDPAVLKKASSGSYGEGFNYDNIKFVNEAQSKIVRSDFLDIVLDDNELHYTALPTFPFYCETVDDLLDRIQANLEELYPGEFVILSLNQDRNSQRVQAVYALNGHDNSTRASQEYTRWIGDNPAGTTGATEGKTGVPITVDNIGCWDALTKVHEDFNLNFIIRGYTILVGTAGLFTSSKFTYGKGNGLAEVERVAETDQKIITRLRAYGSEENLPYQYYANLNKQVFADVTYVNPTHSGVYITFNVNLPFDKKYFTYRSESYPGSEERPNYIVEIRANDITVRGYIHSVSNANESNIYCEYSGVTEDDRDEPSRSNMEAFVAALSVGDRVYFVDYVDKNVFDSGHYSYSTANLPNNMACTKLMLPGFPNQSLNDWVNAHKGSAGYEWLLQAVNDGFTFSTNQYRPYIDSPNKSEYGIRPSSIIFDGSGDTGDAIMPTLKEIVVAGARVDIITYAQQITDDGNLGEDPSETSKEVEIHIPYADYNLKDLWTTETYIEIIDGPCGGRKFRIKNRPKSLNGEWICKCERAYSDVLQLYFPYNDFQIIRSGEDTHFVLTGIGLPEFYVEKASEKLLRSSLEELAKNHAPRNTWQPHIDELWMAREHDAAASGTSLHDTIKAGDVFRFADEDLGIDASIIIENLTIKENGNKGIPTYEVSLRDEKTVSTIQKMQQKVDSIFSNGNGTGGYQTTGVGLTTAQTESLIKSYGNELFLSKLEDDEAKGFIGFVKGIWIKAKELFGFDGEGNIKANNIDAAGDVEVGGLLTALSQVVNNAQSTNYVGGELAGTGWKLTNDNGEGNSCLEVDEVVARMRIVASVLEARQYCALGGNYVFSPAASIIDRVDYLNDIDSGSFVPDIYYGAGLYVTNSSFTIPAGATIYLSNEAGYDDISLTDENFHIIVSSTSGTLSYTAEEDTVVKVKTVGQPTVTYKIYQVMGYEEVKVPWLLRKMPLWARNAVSARYKKVHMFSPNFNPSAATKYRCWIKADDGTTKTINTWRVGMLARCQTLDVEVSPDGHHGQTYYKDEVDEVTAHKNKFYWREVYAVGTGRLPIDDGYDHHYVDLSNETNHFYTGSDIPSAGDSIVCFGDRLNQDTSHLIIIETVGADAPAIKEYKSVGYVDGTSINWSLTGKMRTCISPTSGNIFVAPRFIVEIAEDDRRDLATFVVDTDGMRSTVKSSAGNRNLFSFKACTFGVATNDCGYPAVQSYGMLLRFAGDTDTTGRLARVLIPSLEQGKTYTLSCQIRMTGSVGAPEKTRIEIDLGDTHSGMKTIEVTTSWQTIEVPLLLNNTSNPEYKWIDFGIYGDDYVAGNYALLRHIKLEEGGMATAFTVANEDANYVTNVRPVDEWLLNANIAEDSTITCPSGKKVYKTLAMPSVPSGQADEYIDYISANGLTTIEIGKVYTISYWVKSSANNTHRVKTYMYPDLTPVLQDFMALVGDDGQTERIATDYETEVGVTTEWKKHYIHVYVMSLPSGGVVNCIPLRLTRTSGSALNTTGTLYISNVQLCEGYVSDNNTTVNESYSEIKQTADRIDLSIMDMQSGLETAGVHLEGANSEIDLIAGKVNFKVGNQTNPYISIDSSGKLTANEISAVNGYFSGSVTAKNLYRKVVLTHNTYQMANLGDEIQGLSDEQLTWVMLINKQGILDQLDEIHESSGLDVDDEKTFVNGLSVGSYAQYKDIFPSAFGYSLAQAFDANLVVPTTYDAEDIRALDGWNIGNLEPYGNYSGSGNYAHNILFLPKASDFPNKMVTIDHTYADRAAQNHQDIMVYEASENWWETPSALPFIDGTGRFVYQTQVTLESYYVDVYIGTRCSFYSNGVNWYFLREYSSTQQ